MNNELQTSNYKLTYRQDAIWLDEDIHPRIPVNNIITRLIIKGGINKEAFTRAFYQLCIQFPVLRASVELDDLDGKKIFRISNQPNLIELSDVENISVLEYENTDTFQNWCTYKFVYNKRLYKAQLIQFPNNISVFYLNQHHSITDSSSCNTLLRQLSENYQLEIGGDKENGYINFNKDNFFVIQQEKQKQQHSPSFEEKEQFWQAHYEEAIEPIHFYNQTTFNKTARTVRISHQLDKETITLLKKTASSYSSEIIFISALFSFLNRISLNQDLSIGLPLIKREGKRIETVGLLMEVCPYRLFINEEDTFNDVIGKVIQEEKEIKNYKDHFISAKKAGYEVVLYCHEPALSTFSDYKVDFEITTPLNLLNELESDIPNSGWSGKESLSIHIHPSPDREQYVLNFDFNLGVWRSSILRERAVEHFSILFKQILKDGAQKILDIDILTSLEKETLFPVEDSAYARYEQVPIVIELFKKTALDYPDKIAIQFENSNVSFTELNQKVEVLADQLYSLGVKLGMLVGICVDRSPRMIECLLAVMRVGGVYVPIDSKQPVDRISIILEDAAPAVIITERELKHKVSASSCETIISIDDNAYCPSGKNIDYPVINGNDLAYIIFTSGSTGRPKGVEVYHHGLSTLLSAVKDKPGLTSKDTMLAVSTISFDIAAVDMFLPLVTGATVRIVPYISTINGDELKILIEHDEITFFQATPASYRLLIGSGWQGDSRLTLISTGEALPFELAQELLKRCSHLWNMYGPTETTIWSSAHEVKKGETFISIGKAIKGTQLLVLNKQMKPVPIGISGELYIAGDGVAKGYYANKELTNASFLPNSYSKIAGAKMYKTGDLVRFGLDMNLEYLGRIDFQVKIRGFRIEIGEIETILGNYEYVEQCVVTVFLDASGQQSLIAYLRPTNASDFESIKLRDYMKSKLPDYMIPSKFVLLEEFPLTPNGKVNRKALPDPSLASVISDNTEYVVPRNDFELSLVTVWQMVLKLPKVGITDNFFDLGGDSLMTVPLVHEMERATGIKFDIGEIFSSPTIKQLVDIQNDDKKKHPSSIVPLQPKGTNTPIFCLCGINIYQYFADSFNKSQPVYGIYVEEEQLFIEDLIEGEGTDISIENLVSSYYEAICRQQPEGPYQLAGISFGGFLAVETARLLQQNNKEVHFVALFDTILPNDIQRNLLARLRSLVKNVLQTGQSFVRNKLTSTTEQDLLKLSDLREEAYNKCMETHESSTEPYNGKVILIKANDHEAWGKGVTFLPDYGWSRFLKGEIDCYEVDGDHLGILKQPSVTQLAEYLKPYLNISDTLDHH